MRRAALLLALAGLATASPALAQTGRLRPAAGPYGAANGMPARVCDRQEVRACQDDAKLDVQLCTPFGGEPACAAEALPRLRACWAATGCF